MVSMMIKVLFQKLQHIDKLDKHRGLSTDICSKRDKPDISEQQRKIQKIKNTFPTNSTVCFLALILTLALLLQNGQQCFWRGSDASYANTTD